MVEVEIVGVGEVMMCEIGDKECLDGLRESTLKWRKMLEEGEYIKIEGMELNKLLKGEY